MSPRLLLSPGLRATGVLVAGALAAATWSIPACAPRSAPAAMAAPTPMAMAAPTPMAIAAPTAVAIAAPAPVAVAATAAPAGPVAAEAENAAVAVVAAVPAPPGFTQPGVDQPGVDRPGLRQPGFGQPGLGQLGFGWPLPGVPALSRRFEAPPHAYGPGHRGVDLIASPGSPVLAAGPGTVVFAGQVAGRGVISIDHPGGLRTTYEPVEAIVAAGDRVSRGQPIGTLLPGHVGCSPACLHWGVRRGSEYLDPLHLLGLGRVRLLPWSGEPDITRSGESGDVARAGGGGG